MGALIRTKGTKRLIAHLNEEFSTYIDFYRDQNISAQFDPSKGTYPGLIGLTLTLEDPNDPIHAARPNDNLVLLPYLPDPPSGAKGPGKKKHARLEARWLWFLNTNNSANDSLTLTNDNTIAAAIYKALTQKTGGSYDYDSICFDAVESNSAQDVDVSDQTDGGTKYTLITLKTNKAMPTQAGPQNPPPIDN